MHSLVKEIREKSNFAKVIFVKEIGRFAIYEHSNSSNYVTVKEPNILVFATDIEYNILIRHEFDFSTKSRKQLSLFLGK